jgi:hypothetical protein
VRGENDGLLEDEERIGNAVTGFRPNSAAAPATVGGKLAVLGHWGEPWEGGGKRRIREPGDLPSLA